MSLWHRIKEIIKYLLRKHAGYDLSLRKIQIEEDFFDQYSLLKNKDVKIIFDIGANVGQTTKKYRKLFSRANIYGFEPFPEVFTMYVRNTRGDGLVYPQHCALSVCVGTAPFFINQNPYTNSLLPVHTDHTAENNYVPISEISVSTDTIDNFCKNHNILRINILKMDVQGGEKLVLEGAERMLRLGAIDLIYTEVEFVPLYVAQPLFKDIEEFLGQYGYKLYKMYNVYKSENDTPLAGDCIFIKNS